jgi:hypothetical protein
MVFATERTLAVGKRQLGGFSFLYSASTFLKSNAERKVLNCKQYTTILSTSVFNKHQQDYDLFDLQ